jgi:hypothetical protein
MQESETVTVTLPVSEKKVVIRNYTTHADDDKAESLLVDNVLEASDGNSKYPIRNYLDFKKSYVNSLVLSIDEDTENISSALLSLRSEDYRVIEKAIDKIVTANSPKVKEA